MATDYMQVTAARASYSILTMTDIFPKYKFMKWWPSNIMNNAVVISREILIVTSLSVKIKHSSIKAN